MANIKSINGNTIVVGADGIEDGAINLAKINASAFGGYIYNMNTTEDGVATPELYFFTGSIPLASGETHTIVVTCDVTKNAADTWSNLYFRIKKNTAYKGIKVETFDTTHAVGQTKTLTATFTGADVTIDTLTSVTVFFDRGPTQLKYNVTVTDLVITVDGTRVYPTSIGTSYNGTLADWFTQTPPAVGYIATQDWVSGNFAKAPTAELDMGRYLMPTFYQVYDDSDSPKYRAFDIYVDYLDKKAVSSHVLFGNGSDRFTIFPNVSQANDTDMQTKTVSFKSDLYDIDDESVSVVSTKASVENVTPKVLCIGDSALAGYGADGAAWNRIFAQMVTQEDVDFDRSTGLVMLGTMGYSTDYSFTYGGQTHTIEARHEGRSGWSLRDYSFYKDFTNDGNPFYDSSLATTNKLSIEKWLERYRTMDDSGNRLSIDSPNIGTEIDATALARYNVCTPDVVVINLGHNDFYQYDVSAYFDYYDGVIAQIRSELQDAYIVVCVTMPTVYCAHPEQYHDYDVPDKTPPSYFTRYLDNVAHWNDFIDSNTDSKILVMPQYNITPTVLSYEWESAENCGATQYVTTDEYGIAHPYKPAHWAWGYQLYAMYKYIQTLTSA